MIKLLKGIADFRKRGQKQYVESFSFLSQGQSPDALFIACSDSRVVPNTFASTNPGDLFVIRNPGNFMPSCQHDKNSSEVAALEFSISILNVKDIIVCGHSDCGAIKALMAGREKITNNGLKNWLIHGDGIFNLSKTKKIKFTPHSQQQNQLSQLNVLLQMENIKSHPVVQEKMHNQTIKVHGWWFDLQHADVYYFNEDENQFILIDEVEAERLIFENQKR